VGSNPIPSATFDKMKFFPPLQAQRESSETPACLDFPEFYSIQGFVPYFLSFIHFSPKKAAA